MLGMTRKTKTFARKNYLVDVDRCFVVVLPVVSQLSLLTSGTRGCSNRLGSKSPRNAISLKR